MTIETDPNKIKDVEIITREDLDLIGSDGNMEGNSGNSNEDRKSGPDDGDLLG